jgi:predicted MPP superfamily phosphohydrolase
LQETSLTPVDVQFSGHTHNGQLFPLNYIFHSIYELPWGYKKIRNTHFFVTSGLRLWGPPVKTAGKSEIMLVNINSNNFKIYRLAKYCNHWYCQVISSIRT